MQIVILSYSNNQKWFLRINTSFKNSQQNTLLRNAHSTKPTAISCSPVLLIPYRHIATISKHSPPIQPSRSFFYSHKDKQVIYEYKEKLLLKALFSIQKIDSKKFKYMVEYSMEDTIGKLVCEKKVAKKIFLESKQAKIRI